jgi:hypothetical protein
VATKKRVAAARPNQISGSPPDPSAVERGMYLFPFIRLAREPAKVLPQNRRSLSSIPGDLMSDLGYAVSSSACSIEIVIEVRDAISR